MTKPVLVLSLETYRHRGVCFQVRRHGSESWKAEIWYSDTMHLPAFPSKKTAIERCVEIIDKKVEQCR